MSNRSGGGGWGTDGQGMDELGGLGRRIERALQALQRRMARQQLKLAELKQRVADLNRLLEQSKNRTPDPPLQAGPPPLVDTTTARQVEIRPLSRARSMARIDGRNVRLSRSLADFLEALAGDCGQVRDELVGFKSSVDLRATLAKRLGRQCTPRDLAVLTHRLRAALRASGLSRDLVQTSRRWGLRFRRAQSGADVIDGANP